MKLILPAQIKLLYNVPPKHRIVQLNWRTDSNIQDLSTIYQILHNHELLLGAQRFSVISVKLT
jgi:hypothetical protein